MCLSISSRSTLYVSSMTNMGFSLESRMNKPRRNKPPNNTDTHGTHRLSRGERGVPQRSRNRLSFRGSCFSSCLGAREDAQQTASGDEHDRPEHEADKSECRGASEQSEKH